MVLPFSLKKLYGSIQVTMTVQSRAEFLIFVIIDFNSNIINPRTILFIHLSVCHTIQVFHGQL